MRLISLRIFSNLLIGLSAILILSSDTFASIAWRGVVLDEETGKPIEGVVIVRSWDRVTATPYGTDTSLIAFKETLSGKEGKFRIFNKLPSFSLPISHRRRVENNRPLIPILYHVVENPPFVYKPGYKFLILSEKPQAIELTKIPTIIRLREKELNEAKRYIDFDFNYPTNIFRQTIEEEGDFIETSFYLIDALPLIDSLKGSSSSVAPKNAVNLLSESADVRATDSLIGILDDTDMRLKLEAIKALAKSKDPRAVESLIGVLGQYSWNYIQIHSCRTNRSMSSKDR